MIHSIIVAGPACVPDSADIRATGGVTDFIIGTGDPKLSRMHGENDGPSGFVAGSAMDLPRPSTVGGRSSGEIT